MTIRIKQQTMAMAIIRALCNARMFWFVEIGQDGTYHIHSTNEVKK